MATSYWDCSATNKMDEDEVKALVEAGCMFYPSSHTGVEKWSAAVAVIGAVCED